MNTAFTFRIVTIQRGVLMDTTELSIEELESRFEMEAVAEAADLNSECSSTCKPDF